MWMLLSTALAEPWVQAEGATSVLSVGPDGAAPCRQVEAVSWVCPEGDHALVDGAALLAWAKGEAPPEEESTPSKRTVLVEVDRGPMTMAPMVQLRRGPDSVELSCRDDGAFPDRIGNDDIATCAGVGIAGSPLQVEVRGQETRSFTVDVGDTMLVQIRITEDAAGVNPWALVDTPQAADPEHIEHEGQPSDRPTNPDQPIDPNTAGTHQTVAPDQPKPTDGPGMGLAWSILGAVIALGGGVLLGRSGRRGLPGAVHWPAARMEEVSTLPALHGAVLTLGAEVPGALVLDSNDVLDILDALASLRRREPALPLNLVLGDEVVSPGEVGVTPLQRLLADAPAGTVIYLQRDA
jgi:hypothetical protein